MEIEKETWLESLSPELREEVGCFSDQVIEVMRQTQDRAFQFIGLYAVGSSLINTEPNDVDVVLVGLDFRKVFEYDGVYLQIPAVLVEQGIVVPEDNENADQSAFDGNRVMHNGQEYRWNSSLEGSYSCLPTYCSSHINIGDLPRSLLRNIANKQGNNLCGDKITDNPLFPYTTLLGSYLVLRHKFGRMIDFLIHGENMAVTSWKAHQKEKRLPYVALFEGEKIGEDAGNRPGESGKSLPKFIDFRGQKRASSW